MEIRFFDPGEYYNQCVYPVPEDATEQDILDMRMIQCGQGRVEMEYIRKEGE